jgi:hypothetical protein
MLMEYRKVLFKAMLILLLVLQLVDISSCGNRNKENTPVRSNSVPVLTNPKANKIPKDNQHKIIEDSVKKVLAEKKTFEERLTDSLLAVGQDAGNNTNCFTRYHIIAGSFSAKINARGFAAKFSSKGFKPEIIYDESKAGSYMVSVRSFKTYDDASVFLEKFKSNIDPKAWIYASK